jgi:hypothetical protein
MTEFTVPMKRSGRAAAWTHFPVASTPFEKIGTVRYNANSPAGTAEQAVRFAGGKVFPRKL